MQVSQIQDHCTHAVIGGKQAIDFGISNSAEFFNILSSTLYKDQILAVVREVLCNAWDAHIEAGCTDKPVQITLENDMFTIKDFGKGIHHDDMGLIYATYGNSTKKNDGNQTGGFGLGCKAPFAYTDHFEVISCHAGTKTIYNLSKSSAQAMGKPGIIPIASFPTDESGLTVSIRIKSVDYSRFAELIKRIVHNGDMHMQLNGIPLNTIEFDVAKGNYLIINAFSTMDTPSVIMVRYGNVIYPVEHSKEIQDNYTKILSHLRTLGCEYRIIFQAPAHSISVTPSRESLSMQEHTINTLNTLFDGFLSMLKNQFPLACSTYAKKTVQHAIATKDLGELLTRSNKLPYPKSKAVLPSKIDDLEEMAKTYLHGNYPQDLAFRKEDITHRLTLLMQEGLVDKGKGHQFLRALKRVTKSYQGTKYWHAHQEKSSWLQKEVIAPLLTKLSKEKLDVSRLYVCDSADNNCVVSNKEKVPPLVPATKACPNHLLATLPYLRNIIVIASRRNDLINQAYEHDSFENLGTYEGFLVYNVGRKKGEVEAAREFFKNSGMRVVDLTEVPTLDKDSPKPSTTPRKPAKKGLVCLSSILDDGYINTHLSREESAPRIEKPEFVVQISVRQGLSHKSIDGWTADALKYIVQLFGDKGGVTTTTSAQDSWQSKGVKDINSYVCEKVCKYMEHNPCIHEYWGCNPDRVNDGVLSVRYSLIELLFSNPVLMKEFGLVNNLTEENKKYLYLWEGMKGRYYFSSTHEVQVVKKVLDAIPEAPQVTTLIKKLTDNPMLDLLDTHALRKNLHSNNPARVEKTLQFVISLINS